jgi:hypothetical protein
MSSRISDLGCTAERRGVSVVRTQLPRASGSQPSAQDTMRCPLGSLANTVLLRTAGLGASELMPTG